MYAKKTKCIYPVEYMRPITPRETTEIVAQLKSNKRRPETWANPHHTYHTAGVHINAIARDILPELKDCSLVEFMLTGKHLVRTLVFGEADSRCPDIEDIQCPEYVPNGWLRSDLINAPDVEYLLYYKNVNFFNARFKWYCEQSHSENLFVEKLLELLAKSNRYAFVWA